MPAQLPEPQTELDIRAARVLYEYAWAVDTGNLEALRALIADDIKITQGGHTDEGIEDFLAVYRAQNDSETEVLRHAVTNVVADRQPDGTVRARAYFEATLCDPLETKRLIGYYEDILTEVDGDLKIAHKQITVQRMIQLPQATGDWVGALEASQAHL